MSRVRSATPADDPPLNAGRWSVFASALAGLIAGVAVGVGWAVSLGLGVEDLVAGVSGGASVGALVCLLVDATIDRIRASGATAQLHSAHRPPEWADAARTESRQRTERGATIADGVGDPYLSVQRYVSEYFRRANGWVQETNRRLQGRFPLVAVGAVLGVLAAVCRMTPDRVKVWTFLELGWPAVLAAVVATLAGIELLSRSRRWERVFSAWREWATDSETPTLPPPSPAVELVKPPKPKKATAPPLVVELVTPPSPSAPPPPKPTPPPLPLPPKPVPPPPKPTPSPPPPLPSAFERLKSLDLSPSSDDDNDRK